MATVTLLGTTVFNTNTGTKTVTTTPAVGDLIVIVTAHSGNTSTATPTDDNTDGLGAYTTVTTAVKFVSADTMMIHIRNATVGSATSTIFTHAPGTSTGGGLAIFAVSGMTKTGSTAKQQVGNTDNQTTSGAPSVSFPGAALTANAIIGAVFSAGGAITATPSPAYTQDTLKTYISPAAQLETQHVNSGETNTTVTWGGSATQPFCAVLLELDISSSTPFVAVASTVWPTLPILGMG